MTVHVENLIDHYFQGLVSKSNERDALFGHLDRCDECRGHFDHLARMHRVLAGGGTEEAPIPSTELALMRDSILDGLVREKQPARSLLARFSAILIPVAALCVGVLYMRTLPGSDSDEMTAKGGGPIQVEPQIEVLCFDERAEVAAHLKQDGTCPAPGFIKVIYASPRTVPHLTVAAVQGDKLLFSTTLDSPKPSTIIPDYTPISVGDEVKIVLVRGAGPVSDAQLILERPVLIVKGIPR